MAEKIVQTVYHLKNAKAHGVTRKEMSGIFIMSSTPVHEA